MGSVNVKDEQERFETAQNPGTSSSMLDTDARSRNPAGPL
jgi:hypothetical protein